MFATVTYYYSCHPYKSLVVQEIIVKNKQTGINYNVDSVSVYYIKRMFG